MSFAVNEEQYTRLLVRLRALEEHHNDLATAIESFVTLQQVNELVVVLESSILVLTEQVEALEERMTALEEEPRL